ncbi:MAG: toll/interleukin-1 receptor domain-containing protein, partial [Planctomycetia bacterium]
MPHDVFISHSSKDKVVADGVCATLEAAGIRCWIAPRDILPGANWGEAIIDALSTSKAMVLIFSANSNESGQVVREVERAINKNIPVIPFRIENVPLSKAMEYFISTAHWLDAFPLYEKHLAVLSQRLEGLIQNKPRSVRAERSPPPTAARSTVPQTTEIGRPLLIGGGVAAVLSVAIVLALLNGSGRRQAVAKPERSPLAVERPPVAGMAPD